MKIRPLFVLKLYYIFASVEYKCQFLKDILATIFNIVEVNETQCTKKKENKLVDMTCVNTIVYEIKSLYFKIHEYFEVHYRHYFLH